jgi:glycosyltransferase involved in cell wall biosynthesis
MLSKIVIIQNKPTQFDVPLYQRIAQEHPFKLIVYYTQTYSNTVFDENYDPEIGRSPDWDHLKNAKYDRRDLTAAEAKNAQLVAKKIIADQPDLVILSGYYPRLHAKLAMILKLKGIPIGLRSDNTIPHSELSGFKGLLKRTLLRYWLRLYDYWHPVGTLAREYLETISGITKPTFYFPYNVDNEWFAKTSSTYRDRRDEIRQTFDIPSNAYVVLGIMKWHPREDPLTLVKAFAKLHQQLPNTFLILVGDGILRSDIEKEIELFKNAVALPGYVAYSELSKFYGISDVFVHPAVNEPWGVSVNEALACGLPVIASDGVGSRIDLIQEGQNGFVFPQQDIQALTNCLIKIVQSPELSKECCQKSLKQWSYQTTISEFCSITTVRN